MRGTGAGTHGPGQRGFPPSLSRCLVAVGLVLGWRTGRCIKLSCFCPDLVGSVGPASFRISERLPVQFPVSAQAWVAGLVPARVHGSRFFVTPTFLSFPSPLSEEINK